MHMIPSMVMCIGLQMITLTIAKAKIRQVLRIRTCDIDNGKSKNMFSLVMMP